MTVHKSQGSEYEAVILPLFLQHYLLLSRNLVYTGLTPPESLRSWSGRPRPLACPLNA